MSILYIPPTNNEFRSFGHRFRTNDLGFRERKFPRKKNPNTFRILAFGDSLTFGVGIDEDHRYTNLLEEMLNLEYKDKHYEVLNFGMGEYAADQEYDLMKSILQIVECDLVLVGICCDDLNMTTQSALKNFTNIGLSTMRLFNSDFINIFQNPIRNISTVPYNEPISFLKEESWYQKTKLYQLLEKRTNININKKLPNVTRWNYVLKQYQGMMHVTQKHSLPPPMALLLHYGTVDPKQNNFKHPKGELAQYIRLLEFVSNELKKEGFTVVDTLPLFKKYSGMSMTVSEWEWHPNYLGHYIYAQSIFNALTNLN